MSNITALSLGPIAEPICICSWKKPELFETPALGTIATLVNPVSNPVLKEMDVVKCDAGSNVSPIGGDE